MNYSTRWKNWKAYIDFKTCLQCKEKNGTIYGIDEFVFPEPPLHYNCRCYIEPLEALSAGFATINGKNGIDWYIKNLGIIPRYYISKEEAKRLGWETKKGNLSNIAPGKMILGGVFDNKENKLPSALGRIWYEADIDYKYGRRNTRRILFSNDGLIFVTYDHYTTFKEII